MTVVSRSLDDLDRLAFRLSRVLRTQYPQLLHQGFTLTDLEERLLPYREVRREMADGGPDAFESAVLRLIAGDRGYVATDPALQTACRHALGFPSPTLAMIRSWSSTTLRLVPGSGAMTPVSGSAVRQTSGSYDGAGAFGATDVFPSPRSGSPMVDFRSGSRDVAPAFSTNRMANRTADRMADRLEALPTDREERGERADRGTPARGVRIESGRAVCTCRYCDSRLPEARRVTFCPHCGMDLTKRQCPACSTELDADWKFCVTCGRAGD